MTRHGAPESDIKLATLAWIERAGWRIANDTDIATNMRVTQRRDYRRVLLVKRLRGILVTS